jgi:hypothetical protein
MGRGVGSVEGEEGASNRSTSGLLKIPTTSRVYVYLSHRRTDINNFSVTLDLIEHEMKCKVLTRRWSSCVVPC